MASVAAAINRASSSKVDADLWWSPHRALLARLEAIDSGGSDNGEDDGRELVRVTRAKSLSEHHAWLLHGLARFKPPSSRSRDAIGAARLEVGVGGAAGASQVTIPVVGRLREAAVTASAVIGLDETQAYLLADRVAGGERASVGEAEGEGAGKGAGGGGGEKKKGLEEKEEQRRSVQEIVALYQEERQSLLKCLRLLLAMQADSSSPYAAAMEEEVSALLNEGLLSNVMAQLRLLPRSDPPKALDRAGMAGWAEASSLEACLLLDILILIASSNGCRATDIPDIINLVQELFFGFTPSPPPLSSSPYSTPPSSSSSPSSPSVSLASLAISAAAESLLSTALHRAVLLLIAAVDVEGVVVALAQGMHFSASQHPLSSPSALSEVDQRLSAWLSCLLSAAAAAAKGAGGRGQSEELDGGVGGLAEEDLEEVYGGGGGGRLIGLDAVLPLVGGAASAGAGAGAGSDVSSVLLAWGLIRMLLQWLPDSSHLPAPTLDPGAPALNPGVCVQAAYAAGALDWILSSLLSSSLPSHPSNDPVMQAVVMQGVVKRCVKGLCTAYLTAFDISNQESLCTDFWDASASPSDAPLRSLLAATRRDFPARPLPFLRLLSALSHGSWPARCTASALSHQASECPFDLPSRQLMLSALSLSSKKRFRTPTIFPSPPPSLLSSSPRSFRSPLNPAYGYTVSFEFLKSTMGAALFLPPPPARASLSLSLPPSTTPFSVPQPSPSPSPPHLSRISALTPAAAVLWGVAGADWGAGGGGGRGREGWTRTRAFRGEEERLCCASLSALSAPQPLLLPRCGGRLVVSAGARGEVVEGGERDGLALVHFEVPLSALPTLLFHRVHCAQQDHTAHPFTPFPRLFVTPPCPHQVPLSALPTLLFHLFPSALLILLFPLFCFPTSPLCPLFRFPPFSHQAPLSALLILLFHLVHRAQQDQDASSATATWHSAIGGSDISASAAGPGGEEEAVEELSVGLSLLSNLLSANQACVGALLHLHSSPLVAAASTNGLLPRGMTYV
ncbi:unnamed protein product, partial [Closterium sp. NIES-65]